MFKHLISVCSTTNTQADKIAIEGFLDKIGSMLKGIEKKPNVDSWKTGFYQRKTVCESIMRTYGNPSWVSKVGTVTSATISGKNIHDYLEINSKIPDPLEPAVDQHIRIVEKLAKEWHAAIKENDKIIRAAFEATRELETNAEKAERVHKLLKNVHHPDLLKNVSLTGLMGIIKKDEDGRLSIGETDTEKPIPPLPQNHIVPVAKIACKLIGVADSFYSLYRSSVLDSEGVEAYGNIDEQNAGDYFWNRLEENDHTIDLIWEEDRIDLDNQYNLILSVFNVAKALERWMHRSTK